MGKEILQWCVYGLIFFGLLVGVYTDMKERRILVWLYVLELPILFVLNFFLGKLNIMWGITVIGTFGILYAISVLTKEQFGKGDVLVLTMTGAGLGLQKNIIILYVAFWLAFVFSIGLLLLKKADKKTELPFVPFLFAAYSMQMISMVWKSRG